MPGVGWSGDTHPTPTCRNVAYGPCPTSRPVVHSLSPTSLRGLNSSHTSRFWTSSRGCDQGAFTSRCRPCRSRVYNASAARRWQPPPGRVPETQAFCNWGKSYLEPRQRTRNRRTGVLKCRPGFKLQIIGERKVAAMRPFLLDAFARLSSPYGNSHLAEP